MGRFLVHVYHRRHDIFPPYPVNEEVRRPLEKRLYLLWGFPLEKLRAGGYQRIDKPCAVLAGAAPHLFNAALNEMVIAALRLDDMEIVLAPAGVNIRVAGILLFLPFVMGFQRSCRIALVFFKSQNCVLCHKLLSPFLSLPGFFSQENPAENISDRKGMDRIKINLFIFVFLYTVRFSYSKRVDFRTCQVRFSVLQRTRTGFLEVGVWNRFIGFWVNSVGFSTALLLDFHQSGVLQLPQGVDGFLPPTVEQGDYLADWIVQVNAPVFVRPAVLAG